MLKYPAIDTSRGRKSPSGRTLWCGPFAVAVLTGLGYDEAYAKMLADKRRTEMAYWVKRYGRERAARLKRNLTSTIKGTHNSHVARVLGKLGVKVKWTHVGKRAGLTFLTFTRDHTVRGRVYLVAAGNHWMVLKDGLVYHSWHAPSAVEVMKRNRLGLVTQWAEVKPRPAAILPAAPLSGIVGHRADFMIVDDPHEAIVA